MSASAPDAGRLAPEGTDAGHQDDPPPGAAKTPLWRRVAGSFWFHLFAAFAVTGLLLTFVAKPYVVPSGSMEQTLQVGDRVLVDRLAYGMGDPRRGDVVVFDAGPEWDTGAQPDEPPLTALLRRVGEVTGFGPSGRHTLVKRVIGTPGERVACCSAQGEVMVDGEPIDEPYVYEDLPFDLGVLDCSTTPRSTRCFDEVTVPEDRYLMLGDHRSNSADSAIECRVDGAAQDCWRWAESEGIVGRVGAILWPIPRWSAVN
ncbi:signal peptidase I [Microbacterium esteraromaticum]|uniref:signal peptidase I n=1 Tax=Microbacterium esteraromaticum TaxID=57043 RepID=UPI00195B997D|nr:signal peptidase I [Microbacterium esteraromaticum]MBM7466733.1 signal peptidase I [Microbacterium esteraromaticum]